MKATDLGETRLEEETSKTSSCALMLSESPNILVQYIYHFSVFIFWETGGSVDAGHL